jgi:salicylate hydroxylase
VENGIATAIAARRQHVLLYQTLSWAFTPIYQSDSRLLPVLRDWIIAPISRVWPADVIQASIASGLVGNPLGALGLKRAQPPA